MKSILFSACIALATLGNAAAFDETETPDVLAELEFSSSWRNQSGSTMTLYFDGKGGISGNYINRSAGTGCQDTSYPLTGRYYGNYISFSVAWTNSIESCNSATGWAGYFQSSNEGTQIVTDWDLAYQGQSGPAIEQGSDTFNYIALKQSSAFLDNR